MKNLSILVQFLYFGLYFDRSLYLDLMLDLEVVYDVCMAEFKFQKYINSQEEIQNLDSLSIRLDFDSRRKLIVITAYGIVNEPAYSIYWLYSC